MDNNKKFIITDNNDTASILIQSGFHQISKSNNIWTFLNESGKLLFDELKDVAYTDKLFV